MSYQASFTGSIEISPPVAHALLGDLWAFAPGTHVREVRLTIAEDRKETPTGTLVIRSGTTIEPTYTLGSGYDMESHLRELVDVLVRHGHELTGSILAWGEGHGDTWRLVVRGDEVVRETARIVWPEGTR